MIKKTFKSRIDVGLPIMIIAGLIAPLVIMIREMDWVGLSVLGVTVAFSFYLFLTTEYTIVGNNLNVKSGFLVNKNIPISEIKTIQKTNSLLSAPAASITDRIKILHNLSDSVVISPKERKEKSL